MRRWLILLVYCAMAGLAAGQSVSSVYGSVVDPQGAAVPNAELRLANPGTGFIVTGRTLPDGAFRMVNVPEGKYQFTVSASGFAPHSEPLVLRSNVPLGIEISLRVAASETVDVSSSDTFTMLDPEQTGTKTELSQQVIARMPVAVGSRGMEAVLVSFPGFAANANGAIHPRGAHNQMTYVLDGMPISDQLTGAFANGIDPAIAQSIELYTGNVPAEFGGKVSGVANIVTRSGLNTGRRSAGVIGLRAAGFSTFALDAQATGESGRFGYYALVSGLTSQRFLDQVSLDNLHNGGNAQRLFVRTDYRISDNDSLRFTAMAGRSSFELANLRSQQANGQDQRQWLGDASASLAWTRTGTRSAVELLGAYRTSLARLLPSTGDTPVTASQARHLSTVTVSAKESLQIGSQTWRFGVEYQHFPVSEAFSFGITDPAFNSPQSPKFIPTLLAHDLSRGGSLFHFAEKRSGNQIAFFAQDDIRWRYFTFSLGARYDIYRFLVNGNQFQPRVGIAYHLAATGTVLRASYNRNYQTPPNENLLISNSDASSVLVPENARQQLGGALIKIRPERQDVWEVGFQQAIGRYLSLNAAHYRKYGQDMHDNDNFFNTGIIFPTALKKSSIKGAEARLTLLPVRGLSGWLSMTHYSARVTPPFTGGLFIGNAAVDLLNAGPFIIDHDQKLGLHGMVQWNVRRDLWVSTSIRHDSGLVSNPSDPAEVAADPDYADLLPYVNLASDPPRVRPRTIADFAVGYELRRGDRLAWDLQAQVINAFDRRALFNFQSIFVGTRLVQPRTFGVRIRRHW